MSDCCEQVVYCASPPLQEQMGFSRQQWNSIPAMHHAYLLDKRLALPHKHIVRWHRASRQRRCGTRRPRRCPA